MYVNTESKTVKKIFSKLCSQNRYVFPKVGWADAPTARGVYIIRKKETVLHVGISARGKYGLYQRLQNHLNGKGSSFVWYYKPLKCKADILLRKGGHTYQYLVVNNPRKRALLEHYALGMLCPKYIGINLGPLPKKRK